jgi:hypothetical protein
MPPIAMPCIHAKEESKNVDRNCLFEDEIMVYRASRAFAS